MSANLVTIEGLGYGVGKTKWYWLGAVSMDSDFAEIARKEFEIDKRIMCVKFMFDGSMVGYFTRTELGL